MTKKHFIALADYLRPYRSEISGVVINLLCGFMQSQNPQFDENRWRNYYNEKCRPNGGEIRK